MSDNAKKNATMKDVANIANVSHQTVSRVVNKSPNVHDDVRKRVQNAINELGYTPNLAARRMGGNRSYLILTINDRSRTLDNWHAGRGNDWIGQMLYGGMLECEEFGYRMVFELVDIDMPKALTQLNQALSSLRPDGIILTPPHSDNEDLIIALEERQIPYARMGTTSSHKGINVFMDDRAAASHATHYLASLGHQKIAFIEGSHNYPLSVVRTQGYRAAMKEIGLPIDDDWMQPCDFSFTSGCRAARILLSLKNRPTAIIASNDEMAFAVLNIADDLGISVPEKLSVISFDDTPGVRFTVPPLTAIRQPIAEMAKKAANALILAKGKMPDVQNYMLDYKLIVRDSTDKLSQ